MPLPMVATTLPSFPEPSPGPWDLVPMPTQEPTAMPSLGLVASHQPIPHLADPQVCFLAPVGCPLEEHDTPTGRTNGPKANTPALPCRPSLSGPHAKTPRDTTPAGASRHRRDGEQTQGFTLTLPHTPFPPEAGPARGTALAVRTGILAALTQQFHCFAYLGLAQNYASVTCHVSLLLAAH